MAVERPLQLFSREKLAEFRGMTLEARLAWLEEANALIDLVHGPRRGRYDARFRDLPGRDSVPQVAEAAGGYREDASKLGK